MKESIQWTAIGIQERNTATVAFPLHDLKDHSSGSIYEKDILKDYVENRETDILTQQLP